jgi:hypothetical protein
MTPRQFKFLFLVLWCALLCSTPTYSTSAPENAPTTDRLKNLNRILLSIKTMQVSDHDLLYKNRVVAGEYGNVAQQQSFIGDVFGAIDSMTLSIKMEAESSRQSQSPVPTRLRYLSDSEVTNLKEQIDSAEVRDALSVAVQAARGRQIVILNEAHHVPMNRAFAMLLARELRKLGFEYLACEAFTNSERQPLTGNYVSESDGTYTSDTMYANFLRDAIHDHWKFVSYEPEHEPREFNMAATIVERILKKNPSAKIFIYVGYGHGRKASRSSNPPDSSAMMAEQLKKITGIDPLSIDQATMIQQYTDPIQWDLYSTAIERQKARQKELMPFVLVQKNGNFLNLPSSFFSAGQIDLQVIFPTYSIDPATGRANWLASLAKLTPQSIPSELLPTKSQRLIYAYRVDDPVDAVPVDVVLVDPRKPVPKLLVPRGGKFRYAYED